MILVLGAIAVLVVALVFVLWRVQERILFQPPELDAPVPETGRIIYDALDGQRLTGFLVGDPASARGIVICFHGNADLAVRQLEWAHVVQRVTDCAVFLAEYRGYMSLGGLPTYESTKLDARAAYDQVRVGFGIERARVAYFGHSLGSAIATELAEAHPPAALLLQSPFTSARAMARLIISAPLELLWRTISRIHFDTRRAVADLDVPVSVAHGKHDRLVPVRMGIDVYEAARIKGRLLLVDEAGHNDVPNAGGKAYWEWICSALESIADTSR